VAAGIFLWPGTTPLKTKQAKIEQKKVQPKHQKVHQPILKKPVITASTSEKIQRQII